MSISNLDIRNLTLQERLKELHIELRGIAKRLCADQDEDSPDHAMIIIEEYSNKFPHSMFVSWFIKWAQNLLKLTAYKDGRYDRPLSSVSSIPTSCVEGSQSTYLKDSNEDTSFDNQLKCEIIRKVVSSDSDGQKQNEEEANEYESMQRGGSEMTYNDLDIEYCVVAQTLGHKTQTSKTELDEPGDTVSSEDHPQYPEMNKRFKSSSDHEVGQSQVYAIRYYIICMNGVSILIKLVIQM